jgi:hypothetical protein
MVKAAAYAIAGKLMKDYSISSVILSQVCSKQTKGGVLLAKLLLVAEDLLCGPHVNESQGGEHGNFLEF